MKALNSISTKCSSKNRKTFKSVKNNKKLMKGQIQINATFRISENSALNNKSISQIEEKFQGVRVVSINNPSFSYFTKKVVGEDISKDFILQAPVFVTLEGDYDKITGLGASV